MQQSLVSIDSEAFHEHEMAIGRGKRPFSPFAPLDFSVILCPGGILAAAIMAIHFLMSL